LDKVLATPRLGELRIQKKLILNKDKPNNIEVVIGEVEIVDNELHYIISFGGDKKIRIIGKDNWMAFVELVQWLDWDPNETQEVYIPQLDNFSEGDTYENTIPKIISPSKTLAIIYPEIDDEIIDGMPIDEDE
jgi:hypothetical protein